MTDWAATYEPLIGRKIEVLRWRPMTSDTPDLLRDFERPSFSFTGAVQMLLEQGHELFLTWKQVEGSYHTVLSDQDDWLDDPLDRVRVNANAPWGFIEDSVLRRVTLFTTPDIESRNIVGLRHTFEMETGSIQFWVGTGGTDFIGDSDDLWVGVGVEPPNFDQLIEVGHIGT